MLNVGVLVLVRSLTWQPMSGPLIEISLSFVGMQTNKFKSFLFLLQHRARRLSGDSDLHLHLHHPISITPLLWRFQSSSSSSNLDHSIEDPQKESVLFHRRSKRRSAQKEREEVGDGFKDDFSLDRVSSQGSHLLSDQFCLGSEIVVYRMDLSKEWSFISVQICILVACIIELLGLAQQLRL